MLFVSHPEAILAFITQSKAVIRGEFALAFLLREPGFSPTRLDIYVGESMFSRMVQQALHDPSIAFHLVFEHFLMSTGAFAHTRDIRRSAMFHTLKGGRVYIHESVTVSPLSPITRTWCTGLTNFLTEFSYGCAYPGLTFNRECLLSDFLTEGMHPDDFDTMSQMTNIGFVFVNHPTQLPRYGHVTDIPEDQDEYRCMARQYICPGQARYFGDRGSFIVFFDPLENHVWIAASRSVAPFGHMGVWRLWNSGACAEGCLHKDNILPRGVIAMPSVFTPYSVFRPPIHHLPPHRTRTSRSRLGDARSRRAVSR